MSKHKTQTLFFKYALCLGVLGLWLALYYGPWQFADNLAGQVSIGSSQVRYFLPLYVLSLPLVAYLLAIIYSWNWSGKIVAILIGVALIGSSVKGTFGEYEAPGFRGSLYSDFLRLHVKLIGFLNCNSLLFHQSEQRNFLKLENDGKGIVFLAFRLNNLQLV